MKINDIPLFVLWEQGVAGSNPATPTVENQKITCKNVSLWFCYVPTICSLSLDIDIRFPGLRMLELAFDMV